MVPKYSLMLTCKFLTGFVYSDSTEKEIFQQGIYNINVLNFTRDVFLFKSRIQKLYGDNFNI